MRHDPKKMAAAAKAWNDGASWPEIARKFGFVTTSAGMMAVRNYAKRNGLTLRYANGNDDPERRAKSAKLHDQGWSLLEIAMELGWSDGGAAFRGIERHKRAEALARFAKAARKAAKEAKEANAAKKPETPKKPKKASKSGAAG